MLSRKAEENRKARRERAESYDGLFDPRAIAIAGFASSAAYLSQPSLALKVALFALFLAIALYSGKKISILTTIFVTLGIVLANLLMPLGKVLFRLGPFAVTETALLEGLDKALTFEGLIYISKATIRTGLRLPGRFGSIIAQAFVYYDRIIEYRGKIKPATLFEDIDDLMITIGNSATESPGPDAKRSHGRLGYALSSALVALSWAALGAGFLIVKAIGS